MSLTSRTEVRPSDDQVDRAQRRGLQEHPVHDLVADAQPGGQEQLDRRDVADDQHGLPGVLGRGSAAGPGPPARRRRRSTPRPGRPTSTSAMNRRGGQRVLLLRPRRRSAPRGRRSRVRRRSLSSVDRQPEGRGDDLGGLPRAPQRRGDDHVDAQVGHACARPPRPRPGRCADSGRSLRPLNRRSGVCSVCPCRSRCVTVVTTRRRLGGRLDVVLEDDGLGGRVAVHRLAVHRAVGQRVGGAVLRARHPGVADRAQLPGDAAGLQRRAASCRGA